MTPLTLSPLPSDDWTDTNELARTVLGDLAETARAQAQAQGYAVGWAQGRRDAQAAAQLTAQQVEEAHRAAEARREDEHQAAVRALRLAAEQVRGLLTELCTSVAEQSTDLAWALTETLVGREVEVASAADVVRRVLDVLPATPTATVRLHPDVAGSDAVSDLVSLGLDIVADAGLGRADALVESAGTVADLRVSSALDRVRKALS